MQEQECRQIYAKHIGWQAETQHRYCLLTAMADKTTNICEIGLRSQRIFGKRTQAYWADLGKYVISQSCYPPHTLHVHVLAMLVRERNSWLRHSGAQAAFDREVPFWGRIKLAASQRRTQKRAMPRNLNWHANHVLVPLATLGRRGKRRTVGAPKDATKRR